MTPQLVLTGALVADGTRRPPEAADVVVTGELIASVHRPGTAPSGGEVIDCTGKVLAPGFIDIHTHSDLSRIGYPGAETRVLQGVTTEVTGNCGMSPFPVTPDVAALRSVIGPVDVCPQVAFTWNDLDGYLAVLEATPAATNVAPLIGHGSVRQWALGPGASTVTADLLDVMRRAVRDALDQGVWGMSLGLMYAPGELAGHAELTALAREVARGGGLLAAHMRSYDADALLGSIEEVTDVARAAGAALQISHLRSIGDRDAVAMNGALEFLTRADLDVEADAYPYLAGHTTLLQLFPPHVRGLGTEAILDLVRQDPGTAADLLRTTGFAPEAITVAKAAGAPEDSTGRTLAELAELGGLAGLGEPAGPAGPAGLAGSAGSAGPAGPARLAGPAGLAALGGPAGLAEFGDGGGRDWAEVAVGLLDRCSGMVDVIVVGSTREDTLRSLSDPLVSIASDGAALALTHRANLAHPRSIGTFPRAISELLGHGLPLQDVIHKATGKPAARLGMSDRGVIAPGKAADLVVLDPAELADRATYLRPLVPPSGVEHVLVNGGFVVRDGRPTGLRPGRLLRRN